MDNTLLISIVALILGLIFGWLLARMTGRGGINELETRARQAQAAADGAKLDVTNLQSELNIKQTHIGTLNANIGILEEKLRQAEQGGASATATIVRLQDDLKVASVDRPAFEEELRQRDAELGDLRLKLQGSQAEVAVMAAELAAIDDLRRQVDTLSAEKTDLEAALVEAKQQVEIVEGIAEGAVEEDDIELAERTTLVADGAQAEPSPEQADAMAEAQKEIFSLRDGIATLAFAGAELAGAYEKRTKENEELLVRIGSDAPARSSAQPDVVVVQTESEANRSPAGTVGLVAGGAALAKIADEHQENAELNEAKAQIEALKQQYVALQADLQTETQSKADLTGELQARLTDLSGLKETLSAADGELDALIGPQPEGGVATTATVAAEASKPVGVIAKLAVVKTIVDGLKSSKADLETKLHATEGELDASKTDLEAKLQASTSELDGLKSQIADVTADVDGLIGDQPAATGAEGDVQAAAPADLKAKLGLVKGNISNLSSLKAELEARLQSGDIELGALRKKLVSIDGVLSGILGIQAQGDRSTAATESTKSAAPATGPTTGG